MLLFDFSLMTNDANVELQFSLPAYHLKTKYHPIIFMNNGSKHNELEIGALLQASPKGNISKSLCFHKYAHP